MLFDHAQLKHGDCVLVLGGSGNVGAYAVQLAHLAGAHVVATARGPQHEFVRSLGADEVLENDIIRKGEPTRKYDIVIDCIGGDTLTCAVEWAKEGGKVISAVEDIDKHLLEKNKIKGGFILVAVNSSMLQYLGGLAGEKKIKVHMGEVLSVRDVVLAHEMVEGKKTHKPGKIVLTFD